MSFYVLRRFPSFSPSFLRFCSCHSPGENCNRGAALGALLGAGAAHFGSGVPQEWKDELRDAQVFLPDILKELR